jgi:hypothetical protein
MKKVNFHHTSAVQVTEKKPGWKMAAFPTLSDGCCVLQKGGRAELGQDGELKFEGELVGFNSDEEWSLRLEFLDASGQTIGCTPPFQCECGKVGYSSRCHRSDLAGAEYSALFNQVTQMRLHFGVK